MHFFDFILLHEDEQLEMLWYNGEQIGRRKDREFLILLYQVEGFYVEVYYNTKFKEIEKYLSFECTDKLDPYISHMDLSPVYRFMKKRPKNAGVDFSDDVISQAREKKNFRVATRHKRNLWGKIRAMFQKP